MVVQQVFLLTTELKPSWLSHEDETAPEDFGRPGHIFPLRAQSKGVLRRAGHTEATIDFARLAGLYPAGALAEIKNEDGSMARLRN